MSRFTTKKGYGFFEATSCFQKAVRLGNEEWAMYMAVEFFNSGYDEYIWKRIKVIASEDIGLAEPTMATTIASLYTNYTELKADKKDNRPERLFLTHAVIAICRAKKSRLVDWAMIKFWREHDAKKPPLPDWAQDMHTLKGKAMGRGIDHFYEEGSMLKNHEEQIGEELMRRDAHELHRLSPGKLKFEVVKKGTISQLNVVTKTELFNDDNSNE